MPLNTSSRYANLRPILNGKGDSHPSHNALHTHVGLALEWVSAQLEEIVVLGTVQELCMARLTCLTLFLVCDRYSARMETLVYP